VAFGVEDLIRQELELLSPREDVSRVGWPDVCRRAGMRVPPATNVQQQSSRRKRRLMVLALVTIAAAAVAVPSLALNSDLRDLLGFAGAPPEPVFAEARLLVEAPADRGEVARLYEAPSSAGGTCWFVDRVPAGSPVHTSDDDAGGMCQIGQRGQPPASNVPMSWSIGMQPKTPNNVAGWRAPVLDGWVNPELGATRIALEWTGGSVELPFANDHFLFVSELLYDPPDANFPYELVAYDASGAEVGRTRIVKTALRVG
jgi:hypothetical protein